MKLESLLTVFGAGVGYASQEVTADMFPPLSDMLDADTIDKLLLPCAAAAIGCLDHANVDISALFAKVIPPESITPLITCSLEAAYDNEALFGDCITVLGETEIGRVAETCRAELETCEGEGVQSDGILWCVHEAADEGNNFSCLTETSAVVGVTFVAPTPSPVEAPMQTCSDFEPARTSGLDILCYNAEDPLLTFNPAVINDECAVADGADPDFFCRLTCCCRKKWVQGACISTTSKSPNSIKGCSASQPLGDKCEADKKLPDGLGTKWNTNHCPGNYEIFEVVCQ